MRRIHLLTLTVLLAMSAAAQQQWRFHLAFEDGTGARDTIWMLYDTAAQLFYANSDPLVDTLLGEGPVSFDPGDFHGVRFGFAAAWLIYNILL